MNGLSAHEQPGEQKPSPFLIVCKFRVAGQRLVLFKHVWDKGSDKEQSDPDKSPGTG